MNTTPIMLYPGKCALCGRRWGDHQYRPKEGQCPFKALPGELGKARYETLEETGERLAEQFSDTYRKL